MISIKDIVHDPAVKTAAHRRFPIDLSFVLSARLPARMTEGERLAKERLEYILENGDEDLLDLVAESIEELHGYLVSGARIPDDLRERFMTKLQALQAKDGLHPS